MILALPFWRSNFGARAQTQVESFFSPQNSKIVSVTFLKHFSVSLFPLRHFFTLFRSLLSKVLELFYSHFYYSVCLSFSLFAFARCRPHCHSIPNKSGNHVCTFIWQCPQSQPNINHFITFISFHSKNHKGKRDVR